ncbi:hypothetical protein ABW20_dc0106135 [Dactylellina cionopaga]|nr:hypothetical protein ABW20_dc0106135 [Dactylellina cionopaga]
MAQAKPPPLDHKLIWNGNFCTQKNSTTGEAGIDGSVCLAHQLIFDHRILPHLQRLNAAIDICVAQPVFNSDPNAHNTTMNINMTCGDPAYPNSMDPKYQFNYDEKLFEYRFEKVNDRPWTQYNIPDSGGSYLGSSSKGQPIINMQGKVDVVIQKKIGFSPESFQETM